jgi:hypothetical protein
LHFCQTWLDIGGRIHELIALPSPTLFLTSIKDSIAILWLDYELRFSSEGRGVNSKCRELRPPEVWWPFSFLGYLRRFLVALLALLVCLGGGGLGAR